MIDSFHSQTREITIPFDIKWGRLGRRTPEQSTSYIRKVVRAGIKSATGHVNFLRLRPDIVKSIQHLEVVNGLRVERAWTDFVNTEEHEVQFYGPIIRGVVDILPMATDLHSAFFSKLPLTSGITSCLVNMPNLHTVDLRACTVDTSISLAPSSSILHVKLHIGKQEHTSALQFLEPLVALRSLFLSVHYKDNSELVIPFEHLRPRVNPFRTLERLDILDLAASEVPGLIRWMQPITTDPFDLKLTHLTLTVIGGLTQGDCTLLVHMLSGSPIQELYLDGVSVITPQFLQYVGNKLPTLEYLTIIYRESDRQLHNKEATWPLPSYEYAPFLAHFRKLRHFAWNFRIPSFDYYPRIMHYFEDGFPEDWWSDRHEFRAGDEGFSDCSHTVALLGHYCPTLEKVTFLERSDAFPREYQLLGKAGDKKTVVKESRLSFMKSYFGLDVFGSPDLDSNDD